MAWLSGWSYRKEITITGQSGAGTDFQVDLSIGDSAGGDFHLEGHCTSFPQDIEVTDNDGSTPLDFWIEDITADPIKMWVEVADDLGTNQTIYVYYGKGESPTSSNGANTFIQYHGAASSGFNDSLVIPAICVYEVRAKPTSSDANVHHGMTNASDRSDDEQVITLKPATNTRGLAIRNESTETYISETNTVNVDQWYKGKFTNDGSDVHGYWDDDEIVTGSSTNLPDETMGLRFHIFAGTAEQDWSFARKYNSPEPTFSSAGSEETPPVTGHPWFYERKQ